MNILTLLALTIAVASHVAHSWDQGHRDYILNKHNEMRRRPNACEMNKMEYDMDLERQAAGWARRCRFQHEMKKGRGENLAYSTSKDDDEILIDNAMDSWYDEIKMYRYGQRSCSPLSCHYTQLVWAKTTKVGCYSHQCPYLSGATRDSWFLVCFYSPMGNWDGEKPYKTSCPSKCAMGQTEDNGLCVGKARVECKDRSSMCSDWAQRGECYRNPNWMKPNCQKSCNSCPCELP